MFPKNHSSFTQKITLGLSVHRLEMIPIMAEEMRQHDAVFLEEPPSAGFEQMLAGELTIDDYVRQLDMEYPAFSRKLYSLMRELEREGKKIHQVEPFLKILEGIHNFFAEGHGPKDLRRDSIQYPVYLVERNATKALLAYYQTVMTGSFDDTVEAVKQFARMDAARFRLRDSLRAQEISSMAKNFSSAYVEAGMMHYPLWRILRKQLLPRVRVRLLFMADSALNAMGIQSRLYGPGDRLTLLYLFRPDARETAMHQVLAARSIIYSKIIEKEELTDDIDAFPHLRDEIACIGIAKQLGLEDCRNLFKQIRRTKSAEASQIVAEYLAKTKSGKYLTWS
jgi:hypothetical protein